MEEVVTFRSGLTEVSAAGAAFAPAASAAASSSSPFVCNCWPSMQASAMREEKSRTALKASSLPGMT
jgi:hypothetical protein